MRTFGLSGLMIPVLTTLWSTAASAGSHGSEDCQGLKVTGPGHAKAAYDCIGQLETSLKSHNEAGTDLLGHVDLEFLQTVEGLVGTVDNLRGKITELEGKIATLEGELANLNGAETVDATFPEGAVLMLTKSLNGEDNHQNPCPAGWSFFQEGVGRMPIGAGQPPGKLSAEFSKKYGKYDLYDPKSDQMEAVNVRPYRQDNQDNWLFYRPMELGGAEEVRLSERQMPSHEHVQTTGVGQSGTGPATGVAAAAVFNVPMVDTPNISRASGGTRAHDNMPPWIALYYCVKVKS